MFVMLEATGRARSLLNIVVTGVNLKASGQRPVALLKQKEGFHARLATPPMFINLLSRAKVSKRRFSLRGQ